MNPKPQPNKSKLIPWIFVIFFSIFIIVDIAYIIVAEKTWRGLSTKDGYQKGLKYNQSIEALKKQKELGWKLQIKYQSRATKNGVLLVELLDKDDQKISDASLVANIKRPVQEGKDFGVELKFDSTATSYTSPIIFPMVGQWDIEIVARKNDDVYQDIKRLVVR